jgi:hypothetical protein
LKRSEIGIVDAALPFVGEDLWNAYELSWLNPKGNNAVAVGCFPSHRTPEPDRIQVVQAPRFLQPGPVESLKANNPATKTCRPTTPCARSPDSSRSSTRSI